MLLPPDQEDQSDQQDLPVDQPDQQQEPDDSSSSCSLDSQELKKGGTICASLRFWGSKWISPKLPNGFLYII